jgi:hypothetical protein
MRIRSSIVAALAAMTLAACAGQIQRASSGQIGCPSEEITISDKSRGWSSVTWTASCRGNTYYCSAVSTGKDGEQISCKQEVAKSSAPTAQSAPASAATSGGSAAPAEAAASTGGCQYDAQCKGERICKAGQCVDP